MKNNHTLPVELIQVPLEASVAALPSRHCNPTKIYKENNNEKKINNHKPKKLQQHIL